MKERKISAPNQWNKKKTKVCNKLKIQNNNLSE